MKDSFFDDLSLTQLQEHFLQHLASTFAQLAKTRLTDKQRFLLFATQQALRYHPNLSPTALADYLARKWQLPLSTTKFNLNVLKKAGLLKKSSTKNGRNTVCLSFGGQLLIQLLSEPNTE